MSESHIAAVSVGDATIAYDSVGEGSPSTTAVMATSQIRPIHLLGHSIGGMIAMRFALEHRERLASLALVDTSAAGPDGQDSISTPTTIIVENHLSCTGRS